MTNLTIQRKPSYLLAAILLVAHVASTILLWILPIFWIIKCMISILIVISLIYYLRQDALLLAENAITEFTLIEKNHCTVTTRSNAISVCNILNNSFVAPYLTVLILQPEGNFFTDSIVILPDGIDAEAYRQLRVWLRWK